MRSRRFDPDRDYDLEADLAAEAEWWEREYASYGPGSAYDLAMHQLDWELHELARQRWPAPRYRVFNIDSWEMEQEIQATRLGPQGYFSHLGDYRDER